MFIGFLVAASLAAAVLTGTVRVTPQAHIVVNPTAVLEPQAPYRELYGQPYYSPYVGPGEPYLPPRR